MCCDSAHKTLPALTGAAYLHVATDAPSVFSAHAKTALAMFGSTSPSYLILQSLDRVNAWLAAEGHTAFRETVERLARVKTALASRGGDCVCDEPLKLTVRPKVYGYRGDELAALLRERGVECEFADPDHVVLMPSPFGGDPAFLTDVFGDIDRRDPVTEAPPMPHVCETAMSPHEALLSPQETLAIDQAVGRVLAVPTVSCPPAVPVVMGGERIDDAAKAAFSYYGIHSCTVVREDI